jgi:hypothetical protein
VGDCSLGCVEGFIGLGGFGGMDLFALGGCPLSYLPISLCMLTCFRNLPFCLEM